MYDSLKRNNMKNVLLILLTMLSLTACNSPNTQVWAARAADKQCDSRGGWIELEWRTPRNQWIVTCMDGTLEWIKRGE